MIAIHEREGSFSDRWISECGRRGIPFHLVDMFSHDIIETLRSVDASTLLCHPPMHSMRTLLAARSIIRSCEASGLAVFPGEADFWHFDDKIAQSYLFKAMGFRTPETWAFLDEQQAVGWLRDAKFPVVFKLKSGAGSVNVSLIKDCDSGIRIVRRMFGRGCPASDSAVRDIRTKIRRHQSNRDWLSTLKRAPLTLRNLISMRREIPPERGYVLFQEFVPGNSRDVRVTVIGSRAFAFSRNVREGDFRASGSGFINYDKAEIDHKFIKAAFSLAEALHTSCVAFDFIERPGEAEPLLVEMCFAFKGEAVYECGGYWTSDLAWHPGAIWPQDAILDDIISRLES